MRISLILYPFLKSVCVCVECVCTSRLALALRLYSDCVRLIKLLSLLCEYRSQEISAGTENDNAFENNTCKILTACFSYKIQASYINILC